jgi:hypothetical protein
VKIPIEQRTAIYTAEVESRDVRQVFLVGVRRKASDLVDIFRKIWKEANAPKVTKTETFHSYALNTLRRSIQIVLNVLNLTT